MQPPAPRDLQVTAEGDRFLLTWSVAPQGAQSPWLSSLEFEVLYRRLQDSWEVGTSVGSAPQSPQGPGPAAPAPAAPLSRQDASSLRSTAPQALLGPGHLVPSSTYVARVRARLGRDSGLSGRPSGWSPEVRWDSQPGKEVRGSRGGAPLCGGRLITGPHGSPRTTDLCAHVRVSFLATCPGSSAQASAPPGPRGLHTLCPATVTMVPLCSESRPWRTP